MYEKEIEQQKRNIVEMVHANRIEAHLSPAMAMMEIFNVLLRDIMNIENGIDDERSDRLVLSNGHIALGLYAVYESIGILSKPGWSRRRGRAFRGWSRSSRRGRGQMRSV